MIMYIPGLKRNLISLEAIYDCGCVYKAEKGYLSVYKDHKLVLTGTKVSEFYIPNGSCCNVTDNIIVVANSSMSDTQK